MVNSSLKFRLKAFFYHLGISLAIAIVSLYIVFMIWHPAPLAKAVGVTHIFVMMLVIDAILGPLLTFVVAKQGKKSLKTDLTVIVLIQLLAYSYGMYNIAQSRPVYIVFDTMRFEVVQANEIPKTALDSAQSPYNSLHWGRPQYAAVLSAKNQKEKNERLFSELQTGVAPSKRPNLYEPIDNQWSIIINEKKDIANLYTNNDKVDVERVIENYPLANGWIPLIAYQKDMVVLINSNDKKIVDIVDLRP